MAGLNGRQWGLVAILSSSPLVLALLLGASCPPLVEAVLGTPLGGLSWGLATLLGVAGGGLFAAGLGRLERSPEVAASPAKRGLGTVLVSLPAVALGFVPAVFLLLAGPAFATALERRTLPTPPAVTSVRSAAYNFLGQVKRSMPRTLPLPNSGPR